MSLNSFQERPIGISLRLPSDLIAGLDKLREKERTDRTHLIVKAIEYWIQVEGKVTSDGEYLQKIAEIETHLSSIKQVLMRNQEEIERLQKIIEIQNTTIDTLVSKISTNR